MSIPSRRWLAAIYGSVLVPLVGPMLLVIASSILFLRLRRTDPERARWLNFHSWIAFLSNVVIVLMLRRALGR